MNRERIQTEMGTVRARYVKASEKTLSSRPALRKIM